MGTPIRHPLIDEISAGEVRVRSRAPIVRLTPALADLLGRPPLAGRSLALVTPEASRITLGLRSALVAAGGAWTVETPAGDRDGLAGGDGNAAESATTVQLSVDVTLAHRLRRSPQTGTRATLPGAPHGHDLPGATPGSVVLGGALETLARAIGGTAPRAWGPAEPLEHPWDRVELTLAARHHAPDPVRLIVEGDGLSAVVIARVDASGIEETVALTVDVPGGASGLDAAVARLHDAFAELAAPRADTGAPHIDGEHGDALPTFALVLARVGEDDRTFRPAEYSAPNPVALLIGAPSVRRLRLDAGAFADEQSVVPIGRAERPAFLLPLGGAGRPGWDALHDALESVGGDRLGALVARPLQQAWEDDLHGDLDLHGEPHPHHAPGARGGGRPDAP